MKAQMSSHVTKHFTCWRPAHI